MSRAEGKKPMQKQSMQSSVVSAVFGVAFLCASPGFAADTHVIGIQGFAWTYKDKPPSTSTNPLIVDDLKIGDIVEVKIPPGLVKHGFVTIKRTAGQDSVVDTSPVLACGEDNAAKPNAVLRETACGQSSQFNMPFAGSMLLEVMNTFKDPVDFYCVKHLDGMPGTLKLAP